MLAETPASIFLTTNLWQFTKFLYYVDGVILLTCYTYVYSSERHKMYKIDETRDSSLNTIQSKKDKQTILANLLYTAPLKAYSIKLKLTLYSLSSSSKLFETAIREKHPSRATF